MPFSTAVSSYTSLKAQTFISKTAPKFKHLKDNAEEVWRLAKHNPERFCCMCISSIDVSKTMVKIPGGFLK